MTQDANDDPVTLDRLARQVARLRRLQRLRMPTDWDQRMDAEKETDLMLTKVARQLHWEEEGESP